MAVAAGFAGWYVYTKIQDQLNANKQVRVPYVVGIKEALADQKLRKPWNRRSAQSGSERPALSRASGGAKAGLKFSAQPINFAAMQDVTSRTTTLYRSTVYDKISVTITELKGSKSL